MRQSYIPKEISKKVESCCLGVQDGIGQVKINVPQKNEHSSLLKGEALHDFKLFYINV
jgi:hypothetical protein